VRKRLNDATAGLPLAIPLLLVALLAACSSKPHHITPTVQYYPGPLTLLEGARHSDAHGLSVMTMNIGHGRGDGFHQLTESSTEIVSNIDDIVTLLNQETPDIVAFQEIDAPSFWSGNFNHVDYIGERGSFRSSIRASHVEVMGLSYGTALLSRFELSSPLAVTFDPPLTTVPTGFIMSTVSLPGRADFDIDVVSAHLDFLSESIRTRQVDEMIALLQARNNHLIIMGDLNAVWSAQGSTVQYLIDQLGLKAYEPENSELVTFPPLGRRLDWILVSADFEFSSYEVVGAGMSDHSGVLARLVLPAQ
jgi:endonuclease/exonuclease/phosphatase family metal-dependent hydrolase